MTLPHQSELPLRAPYQRGSDTSLAAAQAILPDRPRLHREILEWLTASTHSGLTRDELAERTGLKIQTVCPRIAEMLAAGLIRETKRRRATRSGRMAVVLEVVR